jgi:disulfide bond formation protein DsbB
MSSELTLGRKTQLGSEHNFHLSMGIVCALVTFVGFAPTYYLRAGHDLPPLSPLVHIHGAVFTGWVLLFLVQAGLVRADRRDLHRRLGIFGILLAIAIVILGIAVALERASSGKAPVIGNDPITFLSGQFGTVVVFASLVIAALICRRRREAHKRLMLLATITMLGPAIPRISRQFLGENNVPFIMIVFFALVVAGMVHDRVVRGRIHPAYLWGGLLILALRTLTPGVIGRTPQWRAFAEWMLG